MKTYLDSSAFAKRFVSEPGTDRVEALCRQATQLGLSVLCIPEIVSAMNRRVREGTLHRTQYSEIKKRLAEEISDAVVINLTPSMIQSGVSILESSSVRTLDALHIAGAKVWGAELFVTSDKRQISAARKAGLRTRQV